MDPTRSMADRESTPLREGPALTRSTAVRVMTRYVVTEALTVLYGGPGNDQISGGVGNDEIHGGDGDDRLFGDNSRDTIYGDDGRDMIEGGLAGDTLFGGRGDDVIFSSDEAGTLDDSQHTIYGGGGTDLVYGSVSADLIYGDGNNDEGDPGDPLLDGPDTIYAYAGNDTVYAGGGDDQVMGAEGNDFLVGGFGDDNLDGAAGDDVLWGGVAEFQPADFDASTDEARMANYTLPPRFELLQADSVTATPYTPSLLVTPRIVAGNSLPGRSKDGADHLLGGDGHDVLFGGSERDVLLGGNDEDYLDAGAGNDLEVDGGDADDVVRGARTTMLFTVAKASIRCWAMPVTMSCMATRGLVIAKPGNACWAAMGRTRFMPLP